MKLSPFLKSDLVFFALLLSGLMLTAGGYIEGGDAETMFRVTQNVVQGKGFAVSREEIILLAQPHQHQDQNILARHHKNGLLSQLPAVVQGQ